MCCVCVVCAHTSHTRPWQMTAAAIAQARTPSKTHTLSNNKTRSRRRYNYLGGANFGLPFGLAQISKDDGRP